MHVAVMIYGVGVCRSDFMLWAVADAKLHLIERSWPHFTARDFQQTLIRPPGRHWNFTSQCLRDMLELVPDIAGNVTHKLQFSPLLIR
jgi:surfactin synthase thioesterase subunit